MEGVLFLLLAFGAIAAFVLITRNANLLFVARVHDGHVQHVRGRAPKRLLSDWGDVLRARPVKQAVLRVTVRDRMATLSAHGDLTEPEMQRLRNVLGTWPVAKIRAAAYVSGKMSTK